MTFVRVFVGCLTATLTSRSYWANNQSGCSSTSYSGNWKTDIRKVQRQSCLSGNYYSDPSRLFTTTTAKPALTRTIEWRASNTRLGRNDPTSAITTATIQAQQTQMIAHSHSFKTIPSCIMSTIFVDPANLQP